jgi:ABC-2 type transport system permease protein
MNWRAIRALMRKDLTIVAQSKAVMIPLVVVPVILMIVLPVGAALLFGNETLAAEMSGDMAMFTENLPDTIREEIAPYETEAQQMLYLFLVYQFAPLFLVVPLMMANVIAADSFAGEKERKTLEALIYTPATDYELYASKLLTAWVPALVVTLLGSVLYGVVVNVAAYPVMERIFFPTPLWIVLIVWVAPAAAGLGLAAMVLVSSRVSSFQEAYQLGGVVVLPLVLLLLSQITGLLYLSPGLLLIGGLLLWIIDAGLLWYGARTFQRGELIAKLS